MFKVLAKTISIVFHPLLMPTYGLLLIFRISNDVILLPFEAKKIILIIVAINTLALPLLMMPLFYRLKVVKSLHMHEHKERVIPMAFTLIPYIFSFYFLYKLPIFSEIPLFMLGATITIVIAMIVSFWWKISIHMIGIGGIAGMFFSLSQRFLIQVEWLLIIAVIIAGIVAWARLELNAHKPSQVYFGFFVGSLSVALSVMLL